MTEVVIRNVPIQFPFQPYKVQEDYMGKVLECLQQGVNGVLESPTGTGKTLSLLCASLAWLQTKKAQLQANAQGLLRNDGNQDPLSKVLQSAGDNPLKEDLWRLPDSPGVAVPYIIYSSRTHAQLTQVMMELKRTSYAHVKTAILGSRDQLCIHPDLAEDHGFMKVTMCRAKVKARSCHYYNNLDMKKYDQSFLPTEVMDIEDLMKMGNRSQCCPYFLTREMMDYADIQFMPYNYLLNAETRDAQGLNLSNAVVILDEAHNVERVCEESASVHISSTDIAMCIDEVTQVMKKYSESKTNESFEDVPCDFSEQNLCDLKDIFLNLEKVVDDIQLEEDPNDRDKKKSKTFRGSYIFDILQKAKINMDKKISLDQLLSGVVQYLTTTSNSPLAKKGTTLMRFSGFLNVVYNSRGTDPGDNQTDLFYKVYIEQEVSKKKGDFWSNTSKRTLTSTTAKVINFWCFSPSFTMRSLLKQGVHCLILTSGTLSPLHATISELGIPIPVQLENPHIIQDNQVNVTIVSKGPTCQELLSTYNNRTNPKYLEDLGRMLVNFCRVIPDGILMFFPSYPMMSSTVDHWQQSGYWSQINAVKTLFVEPQRRESLTDVMNDFSRAVQAEGSRGAVFLAVLRGKVSEGMDFADTRCRAVIITGLPYAPHMDPRIRLKKEYVDQLRKTDSKALTGREWYELDATRAVNQAVGRVIRHAHDFGAILLCDLRFSRPYIYNTMSAWLRPHIVKCNEFGPAYGRISKFFKAMGLNPPLRPVQSGGSFEYVERKLRIKEKVGEKTQEENQNLASMKQFFEKARVKEFLEKVRGTRPKPTPQPSPSGLLDALNVSSSQENKMVDIRKAVFRPPEDAQETFSYVQPAPKKRKLKIQPMKFDTTPSTSLDSSSQQDRNEVRTHASVEYLREVKGRLSEENFLLFKDCVKSYAYSTDASYDKTILTIHKVFSGSTNKDLFIGFKRYIKQEHMIQFEQLCLRIFGSTACSL